MPALKCTCCDKTNEEHKMINCSVSKNAYFHTCADLTVTEIRSIKTKKTLSWTCSGCSQLGNSLNDLKILILSLQREINDLKSIRQTLPASQNSFDIEEVIKEVSEREIRKKNIIIYGIPECPTTAGINKVAYDEQKVGTVLDHLIPDVRQDLSPKVMRLGKLDVNRNSPRPIKIILPSTSLVHDIIHKAHKLKQLKDPENVRVSLDKTPRQQEQYKKLKMELSRRIAEGESNIRIKYIRGSPQIVALN